MNTHSNTVEYLSHFLLSLGCISNRKSPIITLEAEKKFFTSAFMMQVSDRYFLVTAGHVIYDIRTYVEEWKQYEHLQVVFPSLGKYSTPTNPIAFPLRDPTLCVDASTGLDFAALEMSQFEAAAFRTAGVIPVYEDTWMAGIPSGFDHFALLGIPTSHIDTSIPGKARIQTVLHRIELTEDIPSAFKYYTDENYFFKLMEPVEPDIELEGMSGGPIFAFNESTGKMLIVGIQSSWVKSSKTLAVTNLKQAGLLIKNKISECDPA